jgi:hypothetical protein
VKEALNVNFDHWKGPFNYYVSKEVGGWGGQLLTFADKVGGCGWPNADVSKKSEKKSYLCMHTFLCGTFFMSIFFQTWLYLLEKKNMYI